jgi:hypothetical protein
VAKEREKYEREKRNKKKKYKEILSTSVPTKLHNFQVLT